MGIVVEELAAFELESGDNYKIEYNESGDIHIHIDDIRIDMTPEEFRKLINISTVSFERLKETKGRL